MSASDLGRSANAALEGSRDVTMMELRPVLARAFSVVGLVLMVGLGQVASPGLAHAKDELFDPATFAKSGGRAMALTVAAPMALADAGQSIMLTWPSFAGLELQRETSVSFSGRVVITGAPSLAGNLTRVVVRHHRRGGGPVRALARDSERITESQTSPRAGALVRLATDLPADLAAGDQVEVQFVFLGTGELPDGALIEFSADWRTGSFTDPEIGGRTDTAQRSGNLEVTGQSYSGQTDSLLVAKHNRRDMNGWRHTLVMPVPASGIDPDDSELSIGITRYNLMFGQDVRLTAHARWKPAGEGPGVRLFRIGRTAQGGGVTIEVAIPLENVPDLSSGGEILVKIRVKSGQTVKGGLFGFTTRWTLSEGD